MITDSCVEMETVRTENRSEIYFVQMFQKLFCDFKQKL